MSSSNLKSFLNWLALTIFFCYLAVVGSNWLWGLASEFHDMQLKASHYDQIKAENERLREEVLEHIRKGK